MKHLRSLCPLLCLLLTLSGVFTSCGGRSVKIVAEDDDLFRNTATDSTYRVLPASYEPISRGEEYGRLKIGNVEFVLHEIPGLAPEHWLCSIYGDIYCNSSYDIPAFSDWNITVLHVCTNTNLIVDTLTVKPANYTTEQCRALFDLLQNCYRDGAATDYPSWAEVSRVYTLRFETDTLPGLYYSIKMIEYTENIYGTVSDETGNKVEADLGRTFLYDRYADRCVPVDDIVFRMLDGESLADILEQVVTQ